MTPKRATYYTYGSDEGCAETRKFLEEAGVVLEIRDLEKNPLSAWELQGVLGHLDAGHFLNPLSDAYDKHKFGERIPQREQLLDIIAGDNSLLKRPIIKTTRLLTIGCDKEKLTEMLRLNGVEPSPRELGGNSRRSQNGSNRHYSKRSSSSHR